MTFSCEVTNLLKLHEKLFVYIAHIQTFCLINDCAYGESVVAFRAQGLFGFAKAEVLMVLHNH